MKFTKLFNDCKKTIIKNGYVFFHANELGQNFDHEAFIHEIGNIRLQSNGKVIKEIKPLLSDKDVYNSQSQTALLPHTECYEYAGMPPRYLFLWCLSPPAMGEGETTLADGYIFFNNLPADEQQILLANRYEFRHYSGESSQRTYHPIFSKTDDGELIFRFSCKGLVIDGNQFLHNLTDSVIRYFEKEKKEIIWTSPGDLLIIDNFRMLHARNAFFNPQRELVRAWVNE